MERGGGGGESKEKKVKDVPKSISKDKVLKMAQCGA